MANNSLTAKEERVAKEIVDAAYKVHKKLGPGLLESIYEACLCHELGKKKISYQRQVSVPIVYDGLQFTGGFRVDVLVEDLVLCELKAVEALIPVYKAQVLTYLKLTGKRLGFLINFNVPVIRNGISRLIL